MASLKNVEKKILKISTLLVDVQSDIDEIQKFQKSQAFKSMKRRNYTTKHKFLTFKEARKTVRKLKLKSYTEWKLYSKGNLLEKGERPADIPGSPDKFYREAGWISWPDWLGN